MPNNTIVSIPVNVTSVSVTNTVANHARKPEKFNGWNFKRWQQKMFFNLTTFNLARFLKEAAPQVEPPKEGQPSNLQVFQTVDAWKHSDFLCHNYVLNGLVDSLYNVYWKTNIVKELWESLENMYKTEDAGKKKFVVTHFLDYKMVDSKNVISQEMSVEDLVVYLRIQDDNKLAQKNTYTPDSAKENMVEHAASSSKSNPKEKGKGKNDKKSKGKAEYLALKVGTRVTPRHVNMVNDNVDMIAMVYDVIAMISKVDLVCSNNNDWWIDIRETRHVCTDKSMFHSFRAVHNGKKLCMGNSATADFKGEGDVILKMTSRKELKFGFRLVFYFDKFVLSKDQMYAGKGYDPGDEAIDEFVLYKIEVENQLSEKVKVVQSDRGDAFNSDRIGMSRNNVWIPSLSVCHPERRLTMEEMLSKFIDKGK
uniref:Retrovirus-related Pol polyprotein from transposon TNT 1-94-like beta-barrel domain-containing protein n=1 Tax=Tanacetum cinerariifolium TaxID=118510 RepID=A0A6L2M0N7_TANCI|nr:hypothetical protein [Tanacetum cinerariifolium]